MSRMVPGGQKARRWDAIVIAPVLACTMAIALLLIGSLGAGSAFAATNAQITVNAGQSLGSLTGLSKGLNTAVWDGNMLDSAASTDVKNAGIGVLRYPGGSTSDVYHWQSNTNVAGQGTDSVRDNFDAFMNMTQGIGAQTIITADYGGGTASEAAGWVQYANKGGPGYTGPVPTYSGASSTGHNFGIKYWEVGNEVYGDGTFNATWEFNNNPHTSAAYANNLVTYSRAMKAVDPTIFVGAVLTAPGNWPDGVTSTGSPQPWNQTVLTTACSSIDFVILHWYPQGPNGENDAGLLSAPENGETTSVSSTVSIPAMVSTTRSELTQFCGAHASAVQILVTETNSVSSNPGKQTVSTVNALYEDDDYMSWLENGVTNVDWWTLHNGPVAGNTSSSLFGTSQFGDYGVLANGGCTTSTSGICEPAANTPFPAYFGLQMLDDLGRSGDTMVSSSSNQALVAVHAVKQANGNLAVLVINKDPSNSYNVSLALNGFTAAPGGTMFTYGQNSTSITRVTIDPPFPGSSASVTIAPYSLTTIVLSPGSGVTPTPTMGTTPTPTPTMGTTPTPTPTMGVTPTPTPTMGTTPTPTPTRGVTPTPTPTRGTTPTPTPTTSSGGGCAIHYAITSQWQGGFGATITITNTGTTTINGWTLQFSFANGQTITQLWNGTFTQSGSMVSIMNLSYNGSLAPGATITSAPGFNGSWNGTNAVPTIFTLNGQTCTIS